MCSKDADCRCWPIEHFPAWMVDLLAAYFGPLLADVLDFILDPEEESDVDAA